MGRRFIITFIITVAAILGYQAYQGRFSPAPIKKAAIDMPIMGQPMHMGGRA